MSITKMISESKTADDGKQKMYNGMLVHDA
jgi:hypothetical protein